MKHTNQTLRQLYLRDLAATPDIHHGRDRAKVRNIRPWEKIIDPALARQLDPFAPNIFVWSDIHFSHGNIIKYCNRPFPDRKLMDACLIGNYQNVVKHNDIVIFGGDIGFMKENDINHVLSQLPGYKIQIVGNHDITRDGTVMELAFDERHLCFVIDIADADVDAQLLFTHYPLDASNVPDGCYNVHGHIHSNLVPGDKHINMCVEHTGYKPVPLKDYVVNRALNAERRRQGIPPYTLDDAPANFGTVHKPISLPPDL
jgi:calcineurin-like phosphoesterase family protein